MTGGEGALGAWEMMAAEGGGRTEGRDWQAGAPFAGALQVRATLYTTAPLLAQNLTAHPPLPPSLHPPTQHPPA